MRVTKRAAAPAVFDEHALDALPGNVRQFVLVDEGNLGILGLRRICEGAAERHGGDDDVATLAQNGDGLRADQAGAADDDDLNGFPPLSTTGDP